MTDSALHDPVECRSEGQYADRPTALHWQGERLRVESILNRWRAPDGQGFRVCVSDGRVFELFYFQATNIWTVEQK